jgi:hypothetical protein
VNAMAALFDLLLILTLCYQSISKRIIYNNSDLLNIFVDLSSLPIEPSGLGVFAKIDIPPDEIICEYTGAVIDAKTITYDDILSEKVAYTDYQGSEFGIDGNNVCAIINDCAWVVGSSYSKQDIDRIKIIKEIPCYPGYKYNAKVYKTKIGKVFIKSAVFIPKDSEIFWSYGL